MLNKVIFFISLSEPGIVAHPMLVQKQYLEGMLIVPGNRETVSAQLKHTGTFLHPGCPLLLLRAENCGKCSATASVLGEGEVAEMQLPVDKPYRYGTNSMGEHSEAYFQLLAGMAIDTGIVCLDIHTDEGWFPRA